MNIKISTLLLTAAAAGLLASGCTNSSRKADSRADSSAVEAIENSDSIPEAVKQLVRAIADNDSSSFAKMVSYPLQRPYPLRDINNEAEMKAYYSKLVDDSLRNILTKSGPEKWAEYGWRGWSLDDGRYIWVDETVYDVNYISHSEHQQRDSLTKIEIASLPASIRKGWRPIMCLQDQTTGSVYRVDIQSDDKDSNAHHYRLAVYEPNTDYTGMPTRLLEGSMESEGSIGNVTYHFHEKGDNKEYIIGAESPDSPKAWLESPDGNSSTLDHIYWHELISNSNHK